MPLDTGTKINGGLLEVEKNKKTTIEEIVNKIGEIGDTKANKKELDELKGNLLSAVDKRFEEDAKKMEEEKAKEAKKFEEKLASIVDNIGKQYQSVNKNTNGIDEKYGKSFGEFILKIKKQSEDIKALATITGESGGYLVPRAFDQRILEISTEDTIVRNNGGSVVDVPAQEIEIPALDQSSNARGNLYGGIATYWTDENTDIEESEPKFDQVLLKVHDLCGYVELSQNQEDDAFVATTNLLSRMFGMAVGYEEDEAFLVGDGVGKPLGVQNCPATITISRATASEINTIDAINCISRFKGNRNNAVWVCNYDVLPQILKLKDDNSNWIFMPGNSGNISGAIPMTLYNIPILLTDKVPGLGTQGDFGLYDFNQYLIGDRKGLVVEQSKHYKFRSNKIVMKVIKRTDGKAWLKSAITPRNGSNTLSPFTMMG